MPFTIGRLKVRRVRQYERRTSGLIRPRFFRGMDGYVDHSAFNQIGWDMARDKHTGIYTAFPQYYVSPIATWDQLSAEDHRQACQALDRTPAGRKARDLLLSVLPPAQRRTAALYNYFDLWLYSPYVLEDSRKWERYLFFDTVKFRFERGYPNGNIKLTVPRGGGRRGDRQPNGRQFSLCLHPVSPYPNDDIILTQMMSLLTEPDEFISQANIHDLQTGGPVEFERLFAERPEEEKRIYLPHGES